MAWLHSPHMYACAADDEKVLRILAAPRTFVQSLANISGIAADESHLAASVAAGATLPALGLSNKPTYDSAAAAAAAAVSSDTQQQQLLLAVKPNELDCVAFSHAPQRRQHPARHTAADVITPHIHVQLAQ